MPAVWLFKFVQLILNQLTKPAREHAYLLVSATSDTHVNTAINGHGKYKTFVKVSVFPDEVYTTGGHNDLKVVVVAKRCRELRSDMLKHDAVSLLPAC
jgi:hypothetical protein